MHWTPKIASHAHPLPIRPSQRAAEEQRIRELIARYPIAVNLRDLPFERAPTVAEVLTPKIRRSKFNLDVNPNHLDMVECWKGLTHAQATELANWYKILHVCLHDLVRISLCEDLVRNLYIEAAFDQIYLLPRILDYLQGAPHRMIDIDFIDLIERMLDMFHGRFADATPTVATHFPGGLSRFLHNFLRIQDCFVDHPCGSSIEVAFDFHYDHTILIATGDVTWQLPRIRFCPSPDKLFTGGEYRIALLKPNDPAKPLFRWSTGSHHDQTTYTISRSSLSLSWDGNEHCFTALVPNYADGKVHTAQTVLKATTTLFFPDNVRFERESRWSHDLEILPAMNREQSNESSPVKVDTPTECSVRHMRSHKADKALPHMFHKMTSPQKRRVSGPDTTLQSLECKRRRHDRVAYVEDILSNDTIRSQSSSSEGNTSDGKTSQGSARDQQRRVDYANWQDANSVQGLASCLTPGQFTPNDGYCCVPVQASMRQRDKGGDSILASPDQKDYASTLRNANHETLQQHQILLNYAEFTCRSLRKEAGLISPTSDGERKAFESIFLEDGEGWSPTTNESIMDFDSAMGEE